ncbi:hypothetical protein [Phytohalomonas tamaricis]|uniref:hypothetical protein n=1 Tax=Phytohalomonas tamaricis TaxID=2081032 RepID=UPI00131A1244|nr:hypothetical protein [Phytohalomonas tamaricis]
MTRSCIRVTTGLVLLGLALFVTGCTGSHTYVLSGTFLTTGYSIKIVGSYDEARLQSLQEGINTTLADIEALIAPNYPGGSELALINDTASGEFCCFQRLWPR